jgi:hypothetical protein
MIIGNANQTKNNSSLIIDISAIGRSHVSPESLNFLLNFARYQNLNIVLKNESTTDHEYLYAILKLARGGNKQLNLHSCADASNLMNFQMNNRIILDNGFASNIKSISFLVNSDGMQSH